MIKFFRICGIPLQEKVGGIKKTWNELSSLNHWVVKDYYRLVNSATALEPYIEKLSDEQLKAKTVEFRQRLKGGATLADIQAEAFAVVREAAKRKLGMHHFDVKIIGGAVLHDGSIAEMKTGEGKTLVSTLAAYLNALRGDGVHVVTVNDYLAQRDAEWMGRVHRFLGLSVGLIQRGMTNEDRRSNYRCDITYTNNTELGFDYLRDNLAGSREQLVMRWPKPFHFGIVDEVDSVLIDEGRNPLLISGEANKDAARFPVASRIAELLIRGRHYNVDLKDNSVKLTEDGILLAEIALETNDLWDENDPWARFVLNALRAKEFYRRDVQYIIRDGKAPVINELTGRVEEKTRWSDGIYQAVEAKGLQIKGDFVGRRAMMRQLHALLFGNNPALGKYIAAYTWAFSHPRAPFVELHERPYFHGIWFNSDWQPKTKSLEKPFGPPLPRFFTDCGVSCVKALFYWPDMLRPTSILDCKSFLQYQWVKHGRDFYIDHVSYVSIGLTYAEALIDFGIPIGKRLTKADVSLYLEPQIEKMVVLGRLIGDDIHPEINCDLDARYPGVGIIKEIRVWNEKGFDVNGSTMMVKMIAPDHRYTGVGRSCKILMLLPKPIT